MTRNTEYDQILNDLLSKFTGQALTNRLNGKRYQHLISYLDQLFPMLKDDPKYTVGMKLFWFKTGLTDFPDCANIEDGIHKNKTHRCRVTGYETDCCCHDCACKVGHQKSMKTKAERYGDPNWHNSEKAAETNMQRYGAPNPFGSKKIITKMKAKRASVNGYYSEVMKKAWKTRREHDTDKYKDFTFWDKQFLHFLDDSPYENFEVRTYTSTEQTFLRKRIRQYGKLLANDNKPMFTCNEWVACKDPWKDDMTWKCPHGHIYKQHFRTHYHEYLRCTVCHPYLSDYAVSQIEKQLREFVQTEIFPSEELVCNNREVIPPKELDIYVPSRHVAFEMNGLYQHSDMFKKKRYHALKTSSCEKAGIHLLHIFEDEWKKKPEQVKTLLKCILLEDKKSIVGNVHAEEASYEELAKFMLKSSVLEAHEHDNEKCIKLMSEKDDIYAMLSYAISYSMFEVKQFALAEQFSLKQFVEQLMMYAKSLKLKYVTIQFDRRFFNVAYLKKLLPCVKMTFKSLPVREMLVNYGFFDRYTQEDYSKIDMSAFKDYNPAFSIRENAVMNKWACIYDAGTLRMKLNV